MEQNTEILEAYLAQQLSPEQQQSLEARLAAEPELAAELALHRQLHQHIQQAEIQNLKGQVKTWLKTQADTPAPPTTATSRPLWPRITSIAAVLSLGLGLGWWYFSQSPTFDSQQAINQLVAAAPPSQQGTSSLRQQWVHAYQSKNYPQVQQLLAPIASPSPEQTYYLALSHLAQGQHQTASSLLQSPNIASSAFAEKANWLLALSQHQQGHHSQAQQLYAQIARSNSQYQKQAQQALKNLH
jgi:anti-sigma factor RsiW